MLEGWLWNEPPLPVPVKCPVNSKGCPEQLRLLLGRFAGAWQMSECLTCPPVCICAENRPVDSNLPSPGGLMTQMIQVQGQPHMLAASGLHLSVTVAADGLMGCCSIFASPARVRT